MTTLYTERPIYLTIFSVLLFLTVLSTGCRDSPEDAAREAAYKAGYSAGHEAGFEEGVELGQAQGYERGKADCEENRNR